MTGFLIRPAEWTERALCTKYNPEWWSGDDPSTSAMAMKICGMCPVSIPCLQEGLDIGDKNCIRAGDHMKVWLDKAAG